MDADAIYLSKIGHFERLFDDRVDTAVELLAGDPAAVREIETARGIVKAAVAELTQLYRDLYADRNPALSKDAPLYFTRLEANIAMAVQQTLDAMRKLIGLRSRRGPVGRARSRSLVKSIRKINASLARRDDAAPLAPVVATQQMLLAGRKPVKIALTLAALTVTHRSLTDWYRRLDPASFFRSGDIEFRGIDEANAAMAADPRRVMVMIGNHDAALYEGAISYRTAVLLGSDHHLAMARRGVYPIPPPESAGDVVYVDEDDPDLNPVVQSLEKVAEHLGRRDVVSFVVYPEGMLAFTGAQMPLVAKDGAYLIARKLAIALGSEGVPVYLVELKTNLLPHLTEPDGPQAEVRVTSVEVVPAEPMVKGRPDEWISRRRRESQNLYNQDRGEKMVDLADSERIPDSITYRARGLLRHSEVR